MPEIDIILIAVARAHYANCEFDAALAVIDTILARPHDEPTIEFAGGSQHFGVSSRCAAATTRAADGISEREFEHARVLPPVSYAIILSLLRSHGGDGHVPAR